MNSSKRYSFLGHWSRVFAHARAQPVQYRFQIQLLFFLFNHVPFCPSADLNVGKRFQKLSKLCRAFLAI
jgi:hypothetical protein